MNNLERYKQQFNYKRIFFYVILFVVNCIACKNISISYVVVLFEIASVILLLVTGKIGEAIIMHNLCLAFSIEVSQFVYGEFTMMYSYAYMPYIHRYGPLIIEILLLAGLLVVDKGKLYIYSDNCNRTSWRGRFIKDLSLLMLMGFVMSLIAYLVNDNGIAKLDWYSNSYISESVYWIILFIDVILVHVEFNRNQNFHNILRSNLGDFFVSMLFASVISIAAGWHGVYSSHQSIILMPLIVFFGAILVVFPSFEKYKNTLFFVSGIGLIICLVIKQSPLLGKWFLVLGFTIVSFLWINVSHKRFFKILVIGAIAVVILYFVGPRLLGTSELFQYKYSQVLMSIGIQTGLNSFSNTASSSIRWEELANIFLEYLNKPYYAIFGKGIGGSILHRTNWNTWSVLSAFSQEQINAKVYIAMHETINILFLKFGFIGLMFAIKNIYTAIKNISKSPWILMGITWFVFFLNAYISMYIMVPVLLLGMFEADNSYTDQ